MTVVFVVSTPGKLLVLQLAQLIDRVSLPACRSVRLQVCQLLKIWDVSLIILKSQIRLIDNMPNGSNIKTPNALGMTSQKMG